MLTIYEYDEFGRECGSKEFQSRRAAAYEVGRSYGLAGGEIIAACHYRVEGEDGRLWRGDDGFAEGEEDGAAELADHQNFLASDFENFEEYARHRA